MNYKQKVDKEDIYLEIVNDMNNYRYVKRQANACL